ncbi:MAG: CMP-N-acetylneuraminic acid synthetase [SAR202 cluster bacterium]|nr:CMP-N-acetylneuraminic acid synthetase [SAR202 cluster bacterium]
MMKDMKIGSVVVGEGRPTVTIAEAACEHMGSLEVAKCMVDAAKWAGADIIKFQLHIPEEEMVRGAVKFWAGDLDEVLSRINLPPEAHVELMDYCKQVGIQYLCTPFCAKAADVLEEIGSPAFKIGSGEMTNLPMLRHIAKKDKPMIVSTGMATVEEIGETVATLREEGTQFMLTHCTSEYPPKYEDINLGFIPRLREMFDVMVGHSDHTPDIWTALGAVAMGARVVEKHFTLDRYLKGPDQHVSLIPAEFKTMVEGIRKLEAALGSEKRVHAEEEPVRHWAHHSVVCLQDIPLGTAITGGMVGVKRPGWGIPAKYLDRLDGRRTRRSLPKGTILQWEDIEGTRLDG